MRMKRFIVQHRKLFSVLVAVFVLLTVGGVALFYSNDTKAEVYIKNDEDKYVERSEIQILEIVAQDGQQVLGYTVPGYEPISKDMINNYTGSPGLVDPTELTNLTGYTVKKKSGKLNATDGKLHNAFNNNVLADSLSAGQIKITVCQANNLTADLIHNADLIYINTNSYSDNYALYYYDLLKNDGAGNITKTDKGAEYDTAVETKKSTLDFIIEKFKNACGRYAKANSITVEDYKRLGISNFREYNIKSYAYELSTKNKDAFKDISLENLQPIIDMVTKVNNSQKSKAAREIYKAFKTGVWSDEISETIYQNLLKAQLNDVLEVNKDAYSLAIVNSESAKNDLAKIQKEITKIAVEERQLSCEKLIKYKADGIEYQNINDDKKADLRAAILKMAVPEAIDILAEDYAIAFLEEDVNFQFTNPEDQSQCLADLKTLMLNVNQTKKMESIQLIADAVEDDTKLKSLKENPAHYFEVASQEDGIQGYLDYNTDAYVKKIETLADGALKTEAGIADIEKIKTVLIDVVNEEEKYTVDYLRSDISWDMALELYDYAIVREKALMYDGQIMKRIGNYEENLETNTCNLYKILLLMRQLQPEYCTGTIMPNIDDAGTYYPEGIGKGTGYSSWYGGTFNPDFNPADTTTNPNPQYFREPAVRGKIYLENGTGGVSKNYVYKHIYTYTGDDFFGGPGFVNGTNGDNFNSMNTAKDNQSNPDNNKQLGTNNALPADVRNIIKTGNKGRIIRYIMEMELNFYDSYPIRILELQPGSGDSYWAYPGEEDKYQNLYNLADYLGITPSGDIHDYFEVTRMSVREFNTRQDDLTGIYDLIYIGVEPGYMAVDSRGRTVFPGSNSSMNGYVYYAIGPVYNANAIVGGTYKGDFYVTGSRPGGMTADTYSYWWKNYGKPMGLSTLSSGQYYAFNSSDNTETALQGNDLTIKSMDRLLEYARAGYPILLDTPVYNYAGSGYIKSNSKMYNFVRILTQLGRTSASDQNFNGAGIGALTQAEIKPFESLSDIYANPGGVRIYKDGYDYANVVCMEHAETGGNPANSKDISYNFQGGLKHAMKRSVKVSFRLVESPQQYQYYMGCREVPAPGEDDTDLISKDPNGVGSVVQDTKNYRFAIEVKSAVEAAWLEENYTYQVLIDKSGTGRFEEKDTLPLDPTHVYKKNGTDLQVILQGRWPGDMEGFIPWRVVVARKDNPDNHYTYTGYSAFRTKNKKKVYLLWVITEATNNGAVKTKDLADYDANGNLYSSYANNNPDKYKDDYNLDFAYEIQQNQKYIEDYDIRLVSLTYSEYLNIYKDKGTSFSPTKDSESFLTVKKALAQRGKDAVYTRKISGGKYVSHQTHKTNGNTSKGAPFCNLTSAEINEVNKSNQMFDMLVFGFSDMYSEQDIPNIGALNDLKYFANSGRSVLFAHDNVTYNSSMNNISWEKRAIHTGPVMRSIMGMDQFGIAYSQAENNDAGSELNKAKEYARLFGYSNASGSGTVSGVSRKHLRGNTEMLSMLRIRNKELSYNGSNQTMVLPFCTEMYMHTGKEWKNIYNGESRTNKTRALLQFGAFNGVVRTQRVERMNQGQLSDYPFIIGKDLKIAETHAQWFNLNLEFDDLTVWYTLASNQGEYNAGDLYKSDKGNGASNYYIYSKGNITYTGAGHGVGMTKTEIRLFINTVVAAIKAGNWAPEVVFPDSQSNANGESVVDHYPSEEDGLVTAFRPIDYDEANIPGVFTEFEVFIDTNNNGIYDPGTDYPLLVNGVNNLRSPDGGAIDLTASHLINKERVDFKIPQSVLDDMESKKISIYNYPITFRLTDNGTEISGPTTITSKLYVSKSELHNLR